MKIKCVALDLDRTTLDGQGRLSEGNRQALLQAMENGIHIIVASGRSFATLPEDIVALPGIEYAVTGNGAAMYHVPTGKCLQRHMLKERDIVAIMDATAVMCGTVIMDTTASGSTATVDALPSLRGGAGMGALPSLGGGAGMGALPSLGGGAGMGALPSLGGGAGMGVLPSLGGGAGMGASPSLGGSVGIDVAASPGVVAAAELTTAIGGTMSMVPASGMRLTYEAFIDGKAYAGREYIENPEAFGATPQAVEYVRRTRHLTEDIRAFIFQHKKDMDSMDIVVGDKGCREAVWRLVEGCTEEVYITSSVRQLIEISHKDAGKHSGVRFFMERLGLERGEVAAFGDADNDVDMLLFAGCGIAMGNASEKCRAAADFVTKGHTEDGVAYGLREILHII